MINERQSNLLNFIIREYVKSANPVGSELIANKCGLSLSSATIRNEMKELEEMGYLSQLHTSGGRIPTDKAYRLFVNSLLEAENVPEPPREEKRKIEGAIREAGHDPREVNKAIAYVLSELSDNLVITRILEEDDFFKRGLSSLFELPEFREFENAFRLTSFFDEFDVLFDRIERELFEGLNIPEQFKNFNILIGRENAIDRIKDETMIGAKYSLPHRYSGSLTMIGPTRMDYRKNIALIKYVTDELNEFFGQ
jgi:heat-inducible transcriptional repressor